MGRLQVLSSVPSTHGFHYDTFTHICIVYFPSFLLPALVSSLPLLTTVLYFSELDLISGQLESQLLKEVLFLLMRKEVTYFVLV